MIKLFHSLQSLSLYSIFGRLTELMSEDYQEFEDDFIFQLPEMVSSLRKEIFFFEPEPKKENESEEKLIIDNRRKDEEIIKLREKLSNQSNTQRSKDEEIFELNEKLASMNFQLEQAKTRLKNQHVSEIRAPTESVQMKSTSEVPGLYTKRKLLARKKTKIYSYD